MQEVLIIRFSLARITDATEIKPFGVHPPKSWFYNLRDGIHYPPSSSQTYQLGFLHFSTPVSAIPYNSLLCSLHCRAFSSIPGLCSLNVNPPSIPSCNMKKVSWHHQMTPAGQNHPSWKPVVQITCSHCPNFTKEETDTARPIELQSSRSKTPYCMGAQVGGRSSSITYDTHPSFLLGPYASTPTEPGWVSLGAHHSRKPFLSSRKHLWIMPDESLAIKAQSWPSTSI